MRLALLLVLCRALDDATEECAGSRSPSGAWARLSGRMLAYGDGTYPVYAQRDAHGRIKQVTITFT